MKQNELDARKKAAMLIDMGYVINMTYHELVEKLIKAKEDAEHASPACDLP